MQQTFPERRTVMIREFDLETWTFVRTEAARRRWRTSAVLEHIVAEWRAGRASPSAGRHGDESSSASAPETTDGSDDGAGIAVGARAYYAGDPGGNRRSDVVALMEAPSAG